LGQTATGGRNQQLTIPMKYQTIMAAAIAIGFTACEEKKAEVEKKAGEAKEAVEKKAGEAKEAVEKAATKAKDATVEAADKAADAVKEAGAAAAGKVQEAAGAVKEKLSPSIPKEPSTDEVINAPPDAAPAPAPKPPGN
jgi:hypothetical protein